METRGNFEENSIKIANYIDDKMSPAEEEAFMQELSNDEALKQQFEDELHIHSLLANEDEISDTTVLPMFQPADEHIRIIETALEKGESEKKQVSVIQIFSRYRNIAAAILLVIAGSLIALMIYLNKNNNPVDVVKTPGQKKPAIAKIDTSDKKTPPLLAQKTITDSAFLHFYKPYSSGGGDPVEISTYYNDYRKGRYREVLSATDADYRVMGSDNKSEILKQYMHLYKGLSYLAENNPTNAIQQFDAVLQSAGNKEARYYEAQWYRILALLKENETGKAAAVAVIISKSRSPYKLKAELLAKELNGK